MGIRTNQAIKGTLTSLFQYGLQILWQILLSPIILKMAGKETLGAYSMVMQIVGYRIIMDFGLSVAVNRSMAFYSGKEDPDAFNKAFRAGRMFLVLSNVLAGGLLIAASFGMTELFSFTTTLSDDVRSSLLLFGVWTLIRGLFLIYESALIARQNMASANMVAIVGNTIRIFLSLGLVFHGWGLKGLIVSTVIAEAAGVLLNRAIYLRSYPSPGVRSEMFGGPIFKEMSSLGIQYWFVNLAYMFFYGNDSLIVGYLFGAGAAGVYYTTKLPAFFVFQLVFRLSDNSGSAISELFATDNKSRLREIYLKLLRYSLLAGLPLAVGIIAFNKSIISLWVGPGQYAGDLMSVGLAFFAVTQIIGHLNAAFMVASGDLARWPALAVGMGAVGLGLALLLGKLLGVQGILIGIALADFPVFCYVVVKTLEVLGLNFKAVIKESAQNAIFISALLALLGIMARILRLESVLAGVIGVPIVFVISWAALTYLKGLVQSEKAAISSFLRHKFVVN